MTLRQTVEIPDDGRFWIEVPRNAAEAVFGLITVTLCEEK